MTYRDEKLIKSQNGIKCRLSEYDEQRLQDYCDGRGEQPAVVVRLAVIEYLDRRNIQYQEQRLLPELQQRQLALAISDRIHQERVKAEQIIHGDQKRQQFQLAL